MRNKGRMRLLQFISLLIMVVASTVATGQERNTIFWEDREIAQLENMTPDLLAAVGTLQKQISSIALSTVTIDESLSPRLRRVLIARIYEIMTTSPNLKMVKCEDCSQIRSELVGSILKIGRGIADDEFRRAKAKELGVQGFLDLDVFMSGTQISITMTAYEAEEGKVIFSDIVAGNPVGEISFLHFYLGKLTIPVTYASGTSINQSAFIVGAEAVNRLSETWKYSIGAAFLSDDTTDTEAALLTSDTKVDISGLAVDGLISWDMFSSLGNRFRTTLNLGLGQMIGDNLSSPFFIKTGLQLGVGDSLMINANYLAITSSDPTSSGGYYLALGWQL